VLVGGEACQHRHHQLPGRVRGIEALGHAADSNPHLFQFGYRVQGVAGIAGEAVQFVDEQFIEFAETGIAKDLAPFRAPVEGDRSGYPVVAIHAENGQILYLAKTLAQLVLRLDRLAFALFFGADAGVNRYWHN